MKRFLLFVTIALSALLAACAPAPVKRHEATPVALVTQDAREGALAPRTHWSLVARIGIFNGRDGGSADLQWRQDGTAYTFTVRAVNGKTWKLSGDKGRAVLEGVDAQPDIGDDPETLLRERVGWDVPLASLHAWVLGLRAQGAAAQIQFDDRNLPGLIEQNGWNVEYRDWFAAGAVRGTELALPRVIFAANGNARVRMAIESWSLD